MKSGRQQQQPHSASNTRDVEQVGRNYRSALSELTFNSKPIITNLTIMAQENQGAASVIVKEIENQLRNNAAGQKLPVLYLIDSICKNVGGVYITNFSRNMVNVFLDAYTLTDPTVRKSFERLLQTWKNGMPGGHPVFPRHIIEPIERSIMYIREKTPTSRYPHAPPPKHTAVELLYSAEPLQCKQCGFRYPKTEKGQAKMDAHLDSHFRQNRKMKERVKRGLSRSWFVTVDEWINGEGGELMSQQAPAFLHDGMGHVNQKSAEKSNQASGEDAIDPNLHTVIMPDDDSRKPCAICGERFVDFWNDDEEEWMYKNAVLVDGKIYHATCHADAVKSGTLVEADTDMPDGADQGLKRKAKEESSEVRRWRASKVKQAAEY
ncbi:hypothetical protein MUCCIDRAFT_136583 [Mucor lusitanicus CBS 277.49]|uniref:CID domain-containing protein n=1 Tax=Mucor lusitanicus CBS 277.49 TaxID=747725 RepID=A0A168QH06_MUCCL|nr:hypothetical protein MUCCIDRAFT_136583 [Mucor lusitanicus CBS 277.49]